MSEEERLKNNAILTFQGHDYDGLNCIYRNEIEIAVSSFCYHHKCQVVPSSEKIFHFFDLVDDIGFGKIDCEQFISLLLQLSPYFSK